jgi:hypothetical protein
LLSHFVQVIGCISHSGDDDNALFAFLLGNDFSNILDAADVFDGSTAKF